MVPVYIFVMLMLFTSLVPPQKLQMINQYSIVGVFYMLALIIIKAVLWEWNLTVEVTGKKRKKFKGRRECVFSS